VATLAGEDSLLGVVLLGVVTSAGEDVSLRIAPLGMASFAGEDDFCEIASLAGVDVIRGGVFCVGMADKGSSPPKSSNSGVLPLIGGSLMAT